MLPTGSEVDGQYKAELVPHPHMEDCYISRLTVRRVGLEDSKEYRLNVENMHGNDMVPVVLNIKGKFVFLLNPFNKKSYKCNAISLSGI